MHPAITKQPKFARREVIACTLSICQRERRSRAAICRQYKRQVT